MKMRNVLAMVNPMSEDRINGIARYAKERGWNLLIQDRLGHTPGAWNGDGIIATLRSDPISFRSIAALMRRGIPLVDLTISRPDVRVPRATSDHHEIGRLAARYFAEREFRHTGWFSTGWGNVHRLRYEGLSDGRTPPPLKWIVSDEMSVRTQNDWTSFVRWLGKKLGKAPKPLAILTYDETDAARLLYGATELGVNVPEELAILSIGNNRLICENQSVPLSSIDQNLERSGYEAARLLDSLMERQTNDPPQRKARAQTVLIPPAGIVTRRSTDVIAVSDPTIRQALAFIGSNLGATIGSPQIADALGISRIELDRLFRTLLMRSVGEEIRRQRIAKVKILLKTTELSISEIAKVAGYCTPSHLTNSFKSATGFSPRAWRRINRSRPPYDCRVL